MSKKKDYIFEPFKVNEIRIRGCELPRPRSGHRIVCDDTNIYCFGGYNPSLPLGLMHRTWSPSRPLFKELWRFTIASRKWRQYRDIQNMPEELASNAMCMNGRYVMIFGGTGFPFGNKCNNDVITWRTVPTDNKLQILESTGSKPPEQYGQAILCHDGYFYTIGGTNGYAYSCDIYRLDLRTRVWEPVFVGTGRDGEPLGRYRHEVAIVGDELFIFGGGTSEWSFELMEIPVYNLITNQWRVVLSKADDTLKDAGCPLPRKCHSAVQIDTPSGVQVFVVGGSDGHSLTFYNDIWRYSVSDSQWHCMQKSVLPYPLYFHSATVTSYGCMYIFGGIEPRDETINRNNILYKVWLCIPKLSEICWDALISFNPDLDQMNKETLIKSGVPSHFVNRLK